MTNKGLVIVGFAGGGGSSTGIRNAIGRDPDIAINHDPVAVGMHKANHPGCHHYCQDIWKADPKTVTRGRPVRFAWFSPDCRHFSKAKGGKPVAQNIRDLAWVVVSWARQTSPDIIMLENVEEFRQWGPLNEDNTPDKAKAGSTFDFWVRQLRHLGYVVEWRILRACDFGAPTIRKRLFLIARRDGQPIVWPEPTHGPGKLPFKTAADIIDWSIPCPSIFLSPEEARAIGVKRPLADKTLARIASGIKKYVIDNPSPFIVPITHGGGEDRAHSLDEPLRTVTSAHRGELALVAPTLIQTGYGERDGQAPRALDIEAPVGTVVAGGTKHAVVAAFIAQHNGGVIGRQADLPLSTITQRGTQQQVVASHLINLKGTDLADQPMTDPAPTITAGGLHVGQVSAFMVKYYGTDGGQLPSEPLHTVTAKERFALVTVKIGDEIFAIVDIGMRMLTPRELFAAQGFPENYIIDLKYDGRWMTKTKQVKMAGNSVCPDVAEALVRANLDENELRKVA